MIWTVKKLIKEFSIPRTSLLRLIKKHEEELKPHIRYGKRNRLEMNRAGKAILRGYLREEGRTESDQPEKKTVHEHVQNMTGHDQPDQSGHAGKYKKLYLEQIDQLKNQIKMMENDTKRKDETINKLIDRQAESDEKLQTIIMKLTQDLEQVRNENRLLLEESKNKGKEPEKKPEKKKTDRVISIQEFINAKIEEDLQRSKFEEERRRLKQKYDNPLQGRSALYKLYIKMFRPDMLRESV